VALSDAYATTAEYRDQTGKESSDEDLVLEREIVAVSRYLDRILIRPLGFNKDGTDEADEVSRVYVMGRGTRLDMDDHVSVRSVAVGNQYTQVYDSALATSAYVLMPRNAALGPEVRPYSQIEFVSSYPACGQLVRVTGIGGWAEVPEAIVSATIELTSILRMESPRSTNRVTEMNQVLSTSRVAQNILGDLLKAYGSKRLVFA
jgi:hypothetical protein